MSFRFFHISFIFFICHYSLAQEVSRELLSNSGNIDESAGIYLQWTLGEIIIGDHQFNNVRVSEGFQFTDKTLLSNYFPDLVVDLLDVSPSVVPKNQTITVSTSIKNDGINQAPFSTATIHLSSDNQLDPGDILLDTQFILPLSQNGRASIFLEVDLNKHELELGSHFIIVQTDGQNVVEEKDETNNIRSIEFAVIEAQLPDLLLDNLKLDNSCIVVGDIFELSFDLLNLGNDISIPSMSAFYLSTNNVRDLGDDRIMSFNHGTGIRPGEIQSNTQNLEIPNHITPGDYFLIGCADDFGNIDELDEMNNCSNIPISIKGSIDDCKPDIAIEDVISSVECVESGGRIDVSYILKNLSPIPTTRSSSVGYYLSSDAQFDLSDRLLYSRFIPSLDEFAEFEIVQSLLIPSNMSDGPYFLFICFDVFEQIMEENEENNCGFIPIRVITPGEPDLAPSNLFTDEECLMYGSFFELEYVVANIGSREADFSTVHYYISTDPTLSDDDEYLASKDIPVIPLCDQIKVMDLIRYNLEIRGGTYFLLAHTDGPEEIDEESEQNNTASFSVRVKIPDIEITKSIADDQEIEAACIDTIEVELQNIGNLYATEFKTGVFFSTDPFFTGDDIFIGYDSIPGLDIGESMNLSIVITYPDVSRGEYYLFFEANTFDGINEADKFNSICRVKIQMVPKKEPEKDVKDLIEYYFFQHNIGPLSPIPNVDKWRSP